jgi:Vam6/Vps39-like protein vacuolar protein sorting-associated protein 39
MIKNLFAYNLFADGHYARAMEYFQELDVDPLQVIGLYQTLLPRELRVRFTYPIDIPDVQGAAADKAYQALINYLTQIRPTAIPNAAARNEDDYSLTTDLAQIIDTSLLKAYLKTNDALVMNLVKIQQNHCHVKECEKILTTYAKHAELVQLYKTKGMHRAALELLAKLGQGPRSASALSGPQETIKYLRELTKDHFALILEFSKWVLAAAPKDALQIFTEKRKDPLPVAQVLAHIKTNAPSMVLQYLEWIVLIGKDVTPDFHNELIFIYLDTIVALKKDLAIASAGGFAVMGTQGDLSAKTRAGAEGGLLGETRRKLVQFLESSTYYNPEKMLSRFPFNDLFEERALLLSRIGQHEQALNIYAHKLQDEQMAERYCERTYNPEQEDSRDVYLSLLKVYLRPPDEAIKPMVGPALALLNKYYKRIDAPKALELLPPNTSVHKLYPFFEAMLRDRTEVRHNNQVQKNLLKSETLQIKERLFKERQRSIRVTEDRNCPVCGKRLGTR